MKRFIILITLVALSSSALAATYYLRSQQYDRATGMRYCYYSGGYVLTVTGGRTCPYTIER